MDIRENSTHFGILRRVISLLLCLSILSSFISIVPIAYASNSPETSIPDEFTLTEEQANFLMSSVFGEDIQITGLDDEGYSYTLTEDNTEYLLSNVLGEDAISDYGDVVHSNIIPEGYVDDSNEDINIFLESFWDEIGTFDVVGESDKKVDLVFVIDSTGSMFDIIRSVKNNVAQFAKYLSNKGVTLRLGLIDYKDITADGTDSTVVHTQSFSTWFDITGFVNELTTVSATGGGDIEETPIDALGHLTEGTISWNSDAYKFAMLITDAGYKTDNQHGIASMSKMIEKLQAAEIQVSVVTKNQYMTDYGELAACTGGVQADINDSFGTLLEEYADTVIGSAQAKKNYTLKVSEKTTGLPVENAQISWNGGSATTNASGIAIITTRSNPVQNFKVARNGYVTYSVSSLNLEKNGCVLLELLVDDSEEDVPADVPVVKPSTFKNPGTVSDTLKGPSIKLFGKEFNIFSVDIKMNLPVFNEVTVKHDGEEKKYSVLIGREFEGKDPNYDPYWKSDYQKYKSLVQTFSNKPAKDIYNEFRTLRKNHKSQADLAFPVDINVAGYVDISYATGSLQIVEGGIIIGVSTKEITVLEWPLPPAPYVFFKLTFSADAKGTFTIAKVNSSGKLAMSVGLKEISISPSLAGTLNLGVPKLVSVGGGLKGSFDFKFTGIPPKKLNEILTITGDLDLIIKIKLLGFEANPEIKLGSATLYPSSKAKSTYALMSMDIDMSDFTPILPSNYASAYSLNGLSNTLTFEKLAYEDSVPQIVSYNDGWMMVWVDSDVTREMTDHMALYYSIYTEENGWSTPAIVYDDGTGDFSPSLVTNADGEPVVVWQNAISVGASTLEERLANIEIVASVYNTETNAFETTVTLPSTEGYAPLAVQAVSDTDGVSVYWLENQLNNPLLTDGTVSIMKCDLLPEEMMTAVELETNVNGINGFAAGVMNGQDTYVYVTTDGTSSTLFYNDSMYVIGNDCRSTQFVDGKLYWSDSEGLKSFDGTSISIETTTIPADFTVVTDGTNRVILIHQLIGNIDSDTSGVYASVSTNGGNWSSLTEIGQYEGFFLGSMSAVMTDSGILWASAKENAEAASLIVDEYTYASNVNVAPDAYVSALTRSPGENVQVLVDLANNGLVDVENLKARLANGTLIDMTVENADGENIPLTKLSAGETVTAAVPYTLSMDMTSSHEIVIDIVSSVAETNIEWGTAKVTVEGYPDLIVENMSVSRNEDGTATVSATISNYGSRTAVSPSVSLTMENNASINEYSENTKILANLEACASENVTFKVAAEDIVAASPYDYKRFNLTVATETSEYNVANNSISVLLAPMPVESIAFVDDAITLELGTTYLLNYQLFPANAATSITFMSNNTDVVIVSENGVLTPVKAGTTTVSVMAVETRKIDEITVTVKGAVNTGVSGVSITPHEYTLTVGEAVTLNASVLPSNATNKLVTWNTDTGDLLSISGEGESVVVTALSEGTGHVTVISSDGGYSDTAIINITSSSHNVSTTWAFNETDHWHECTCGTEHDKAEHKESDWIFDVKATANSKGSRHKECTVCGYVMAAETIPAIDNTDYPTSYSIIIEDSINGKVEAINKTAVRGTTVILTVDADKGYVLETLSVTDKSGNKIELIDKGNGKYSFKMPASKVYVKATFMKDSTVKNHFVDVFASDYYFDAVLWAAEKGITSGTDAVHFSPNLICTRAQTVTFLWRLAGSPKPKSSEMSFRDVASGAYYYDAVLWAVENRITMGTSDTTFSPNSECTRSQIVTFLWRSQKSPAAGSVNPFTDVAAEAYYYDAVLWAVKEKVTSGTSATTFSPNADCTRAQIVTFLYRCHGNK